MSSSRLGGGSGNPPDWGGSTEMATLSQGEIHLPTGQLTKSCGQKNKVTTVGQLTKTVTENGITRHVFGHPKTPQKLTAGDDLFGVTHGGGGIQVPPNSSHRNRTESSGSLRIKDDLLQHRTAYGSLIILVMTPE